MITQNRNFEDFMNFRDMIQGGSLNDRMDMVQYIQNKNPDIFDRGTSGKSVIGKELGGLLKRNKNIPLSENISQKEDLSKTFLTSLFEMNPKLMNPYLNQRSNILETGLQSLPRQDKNVIVPAFLGGLVGDILESGIGSFIGDAAGLLPGDIGTFFQGGLGSLVADIGGNLASSYILGPSLLNIGTGPSIPKTLSTGIISAGEHLARNPESRSLGSFFGFTDDDAEKERLAKIQKILKNSDKSFLTKVATSGGAGRTLKGEETDKISPNYFASLGLKSFLNPLTTGLIKELSGGKQKLPQGIPPNPNIPKIDQIAKRIPPKIQRGGIEGLTQKQILQLRRRGFTEHPPGSGNIITQADRFGSIDTRVAQEGGLVQKATGGGTTFSGMIDGNGHGMEDNVQMPIVSDGEQVATLAVSPKEYVVDAYTMAALGNGNPDEGAKIMDQTVEKIREQAYGTDQQPNEIDGIKALQSGLYSI